MQHLRSILATACLVILVCAGGAAGAADKDPTDVLNSKYEKIGMFTRYFERLSAPKKPRFTSLKDWKKRRVAVRQHVLQSIGLDPMPEKIPLDAHYGGTLDREDYIEKRVYWQIWPNMYASGYLFLPKKEIKSKLPTIVNLVGHFGQDPATYANEQIRCIAEVKMGYIAMLVDPVHIYPSSVLTGAQTVGYWTWSNIRAVDFLLTLPEVDPERIGATGCSGGGIQTIMLMIADDRVKVGVQAMGSAYLRRLMSPPRYAECYCNAFPNMLAFTDESEFDAVIAPRPMLHISCVQPYEYDMDFPTQEFQDILPIYKLYGAADKVAAKRWVCKHDYWPQMREAAYAWFDRWFKEQDYANEVMEPKVKADTKETLLALGTPPAGSLEPNEIIKIYQQKYGFKEPNPKDASEWKAYQKKLTEQLSKMMGTPPVNYKVDRYVPQAEILGMKAEKLLVQSELEIRVPAVLLRPEGVARPPLVILMHPQGKKGIVQSYPDLIKRLISGKVAVLMPDVRFTGELILSDWQGRSSWSGIQTANWEFTNLMWGRPEPGQALADLRAYLDMLAERRDLDAKRVVIVGLGALDSTTLFAGALEPRFKAVFVQGIGPTYAEGRYSPLIARIMQVGDLPQVASCIAPKDLYVWETDPARFEFTNKAYRGLGAGDRIHFTSSAASPSSMGDAVLNVLAQNKR